MMLDTDLVHPVDKQEVGLQLKPLKEIRPVRGKVHPKLKATIQWWSKAWQVNT